MDNIRPPYSAVKVEWKNTSSKLSEFIKEAKVAYKKKGLLHVLKTGLLMIMEYFQLWYYKGFHSNDKFQLRWKRI